MAGVLGYLQSRCINCFGCRNQAHLIDIGRRPQPSPRAAARETKRGASTTDWWSALQPGCACALAWQQHRGWKFQKMPSLGTWDSLRAIVCLAYVLSFLHVLLFIILLRHNRRVHLRKIDADRCDFSTSTSETVGLTRQHGSQCVNHVVLGRQPCCTGVFAPRPIATCQRTTRPLNL